MKIIRLEVIVLDFDGLGVDGVVDALENAKYPNDCISPRIRNTAVADIGSWHDDHPLNNLSTYDSEVARIFEQNNAFFN